MHGCVCVYVHARVHECMLVCQMDSSAFPCLSSFLPISSQSSSFLDSMLTASPSQGVWEWADTVPLGLPRLGFSLLRHLDQHLPTHPHPYCLSIHPTKLTQLQ